jgi:hypothetical protein
MELSKKCEDCVEGARGGAKYFLVSAALRVNELTQRREGGKMMAGLFVFSRII